MNSSSSAEASTDGAFSPPIAVIVPTYNRRPALLICLQHLERQTSPDFEVVLLDDGSTDDTPTFIDRYLITTPLRVRHLRQQNAGPARARNQAIALAQAPVCLMIGDDIFVAPDFVATHLRFHREHPDQTSAALGLTRWSETGQVVTPFMRWLDQGGIQFAYHDLLSGLRPSWQHFYTSNLSLKTKLLRENPFNEAFPTAHLEDIELGYRLEHVCGMKLSFLPQALAEHLHPTTFLQTCKRNYAAGMSARVFDELWPERQSAQPRMVGRKMVRRKIADLQRRNPWVLRLLTWATDLVTRLWCPNPLMQTVLALHARMGYERKRSSEPSRPPEH